jgi:hypothetical protein
MRYPTMGSKRNKNAKVIGYKACPADHVKVISSYNLRERIEIKTFLLAKHIAPFIMSSCHHLPGK